MECACVEREARLPFNWRYGLTFFFFFPGVVIGTPGAVVAVVAVEGCFPGRRERRGDRECGLISLTLQLEEPVGYGP